MASVWLSRPLLLLLLLLLLLIPMPIALGATSLDRGDGADVSCDTVALVVVAAATAAAAPAAAAAVVAVLLPLVIFSSSLSTEATLSVDPRLDAASVRAGGAMSGDFVSSQAARGLLSLNAETRSPPARPFPPAPPLSSCPRDTGEVQTVDVGVEDTAKTFRSDAVRVQWEARRGAWPLAVGAGEVFGDIDDGTDAAEGKRDSREASEIAGAVSGDSSGTRRVMVSCRGGAGFSSSGTNSSAK